MRQHCAECAGVDRFNKKNGKKNHVMTIGSVSFGCAVANCVCEETNCIGMLWACWNGDDVPVPVPFPVSMLLRQNYHKSGHILIF